MAKHTAGPWSISEGWVDKHISIDAEDHGAIALVLVDMEADYTTSKTKFAAKREELQANACLIATAPELSDVLDQALPYLRDAAKNGDGHASATYNLAIQALKRAGVYE